MPSRSLAPNRRKNMYQLVPAQGGYVESDYVESLTSQMGGVALSEVSRPLLPGPASLGSIFCQSQPDDRLHAKVIT